MNKKRLLELGFLPGNYRVIIKRKNVVVVECRGGLFIVDRELFDDVCP